MCWLQPTLGGTGWAAGSELICRGVSESGSPQQVVRLPIRSGWLNLKPRTLGHALYRRSRPALNFEWKKRDQQKRARQRTRTARPPGLIFACTTSWFGDNFLTGRCYRTQARNRAQCCPPSSGNFVSNSSSEKSVTCARREAHLCMFLQSIAKRKSPVSRLDYTRREYRSVIDTDRTPTRRGRLTDAALPLQSRRTSVRAPEPLAQTEVALPASPHRHRWPPCRL